MLKERRGNMFLDINNAGVDDEGLNSLTETLGDIFTNTVMQIVIWGVTIVFILLVIAQGVKLGLAKTPEEKNACKSKFIQLIIAMLIVAGASTVVTVLGDFFQSKFN